MAQRVVRFILIMLLVAQSPVAFAVNIGEEGTGDANLNGRAGQIQGTWFKAPTDGVVNRMLIHCVNPGGGNVRLAIYDDPLPSHMPQSLVVESTSQALVTGWNLFEIPETSLSFGQVYWLCFQTDSNGAQFSVDTTETEISKSTESDPFSYASFPNPFGDTSTSYAQRYCIYAAEYTPTPTVTPTPTLTESATYTVSPTATQSASVTQTGTITQTSTQTQTATISATHTQTPTSTQTPTITQTGTISPTLTQSTTYTMTPTCTVSPTITPTGTQSPVFSPTCTATLTPSATITATGTQSVTSTITLTRTVSPTVTVSATVTTTPTITLTLTPPFANQDLEKVIVYPNPWRGDLPWARERIVFQNLTEGAVIRLYSIAGNLVYTLKPGMSADNGRTNYPELRDWAQWGMTSQNGTPVASGIYIYIIQDTAGNEKHGKIALIK